jgi:hypothetical protein
MSQDPQQHRLLEVKTHRRINAFGFVEEVQMNDEREEQTITPQDVGNVEEVIGSPSPPDLDTGIPVPTHPEEEPEFDAQHANDAAAVEEAAPKLELPGSVVSLEARVAVLEKQMALCAKQLGIR